LFNLRFTRKKQIASRHKTIFDHNSLVSVGFVTISTALNRFRLMILSQILFYPVWFTKS